MSATPVNSEGAVEFTVLRSDTPWTTEEMIVISNAMVNIKVARGGDDPTILAIRQRHSRAKLEQLIEDHEFCIEYMPRARLPIDVSHDEY